MIFYCIVSYFASDCPCGVWWREPRPVWFDHFVLVNMVSNNSWSVSVTFRKTFYFYCFCYCLYTTFTYIVISRNKSHLWYFIGNIFRSQMMSFLPGTPCILFSRRRSLELSLCLDATRVMTKPIKVFCLPRDNDRICVESGWNKCHCLSFLPKASFGLRVLSLPASVCVCVCVCLSVCLSVRLCVNHLFVRGITRDLFKLGSPNLDQRCKRPWLRSLLFWGAIDPDLQGQI